MSELNIFCSINVSGTVNVKKIIYVSRTFLKIIFNPNPSVFLHNSKSIGLRQLKFSNFS